MNQQTCNPTWLDAFLKNELNESEEQMLTSHLDECSDCREELESLAAEQSVWREASSMLGGGILLSTAAMSDIRSGTVCLPQIELVLKQLAPTDDPESLGRIGGYEVTGVVGAGGMGVVLKAHDRSLDRIVAIKVMSPHLASSGSARRRFAREAKAAAAVLHPNVIAIHSVASEDANPYLVMPYVRGASLQKRIDSQGPLPLKDTLRIGAQIAAGLAAAHEQGLVHRDIKPANILLEEGVERVTITDFGLARAVDDASMTCSGVIAGTPQYMSPEQTRGEPIDARSDLFSLGSVLYAMCAGRSPFRAETTYGVLHRIANDNPTPVCEVNTDVPVWLGHIIERLMVKRPEDRFESAAQVAELLEGCLAHVQQPAAIALPDPVAALAPKKTRRPPIGKFIAAAAGAFALFFAGILIVLELGKGTLTIESELDDVPIRIMQGDAVVKSLTVSKEGATTRIGAGKYIVEIG
jgi:serine/threonine protein kinase